MLNCVEGTLYILVRRDAVHFGEAQRSKIMTIKLHNILVSNIFIKPRLGVSINRDKPNTYCVIKINVYSHAITLYTDCIIYFIENNCSKDFYKFSR
jgi:hypothetical protein